MTTALRNWAISRKTHTGIPPCKKAKKGQLHRKLVPFNESSKESKRNSKERNAEEKDSALLACGIRVGDMEKVCEALGLRRDFLDGVKSLPEDIFNHRGFRGFVNIYIENEYFEIEEQSLKKKLSEELLRQIGFTDSNVINTIMTRSKTMGQHLDPIDFIKRFVKDEFKYNPLLHAPEDEASIPKGTDVFHFADYRNDEQNEHCEFVRLLHGTDLHSAVDIMKNGIKLGFGRHKHDFSDGGGFYLTTFEHAKAWARCQSRKPVVLELKIPITCLEEASTRNLNVSNKKGRSDWDRVVREQRSGRPSKKLRQELKEYDCITGPISSSVPSQHPDGNTCRIPEPGSYQLCVIKRSFAEEIQKHAKYTLYTEP